jgi:O-antigen/teichoic acid export membrane protein
LESRTPSLERRVLTGTGLQLAARLTTAVASAAAFILLGHHLKDAELGVFNYHFTLFLVFGALVDFGSMSIAVRESTRRPEREGDVIRAVFRLRLVLGSICFVAYAIVAWFDERDPRRLALLLLGATHLFATAPGATAAWLQTRVHLKSIALAPILGFGLYLAACAVLTAAKVTEPAAFVVALGGGLGVQSLVPWLGALRHVSLRGTLDRALLRELFRAMLPLGISGAVSTLYFRMDALLLNQIVGPEANGLYARTFPLLSLSIALPTYLSAALLPAMTRAASRGRGELLALTRRACAVLAGFALPAALMASAWSAQILWLFWAKHSLGQSLADFSTQYRDLIRCVPPLAVASVAIFLTYPQMNALTAAGRQHVLARITLTALAVKFVLSNVTIRWLGVPGAAVATAIAEGGVCLWTCFEVRRSIGGFAVAHGILRPLAAALPIGAVAALFAGLAPFPAIGLAAALGAVGAFLAGSLPLRLGVEE